MVKNTTAWKLRWFLEKKTKRKSFASCWKLYHHEIHHHQDLLSLSRERDIFNCCYSQGGTISKFSTTSNWIKWTILQLHVLSSGDSYYLKRGGWKNWRVFKYSKRTHRSCRSHPFLIPITWASYHHLKI